MRTDAKLSLEDVAGRVKMTQKTIQRYETGERKINAAVLKEIVEYMGVKYENFISEVQFELSGKKQIKQDPCGIRSCRVPIVGKIAAGNPIEANQDILGYEEISERMFASGDYIALEITGDSMAPYVLSGDIAIIRKQTTLNNGDIGAIMVNGENATIKKFVKTDNYIKLIPYNHNYEPFIYTKEECERLPVEIIGKVVEVRRKFR